MVAGCSLRAGVERGLAVDDEKVVVMTMGKRQIEAPGTIGLPSHRMGRWLPIIEIAHEGNVSRVRRPAHESDGFDGFLG